MGENEIYLALNLSKTAQINGSATPTLPNGSNLPLAGIDENNTMVELEISQINSKIYLALDRDTTIVGFAIAIKEFDVMKDYIGGANIFLGFNIRDVLGMVGLFTGKDEGQSGLGIFVDLSSVISGDILNDILSGSPVHEILKDGSRSLSHDSYKSLRFSAFNSSKRRSTAIERFKHSGPTKRSKRKVYKAFKKMESIGKQLNFSK